jgi:phosphoribosyl 1,2-cyclic phosphodiesterase
MRLYIIGTGSKANGYVLQSSTGESLIIEAGCRIQEAMAFIDPENWDVSKVAGLILSHTHQDHAQWVKEYLDHSIHVYANTHTIVSRDLGKYRNLTPIYSEEQFLVGSFKVKPLEVSHAVMCYSFLISHPEMGVCYFITDSNYCQWDLSGAGVNNWLVECNYDPDALRRNYEEGKIVEKVRDHVITGHFGLHNCRDFFRVNDLSKTNHIVLIHASSSNGNRKLFKSEIEKVTGKKVSVAKGGMVIENFNKRAF